MKIEFIESKDLREGGYVIGFKKIGVIFDNEYNE